MLAQSGLDLIQSFMVVAEELSFRRGAERMNIDQSALSRRIRKLEYLLEFPLFERTTRDVSLTPAGRVLYEKNTLLLEQFSSSIEKARLISEGKTGRLRIAYTAVSSISPMPQAVHLFQQKYPHVNVKLRFLRAHDQKLALVNDEIDLGYMIGPFEHSEFRSLLLMSDPLCVVMPFGHPLAEKSEIRPADLDGVDLTLGSKIKSETYRWRLDDLFSR